ncbi:hypothetical protein BDW02DRAFT_579974 [Decorospora gaudefroyi]|uniref:Uncharacterized protein n=1 Tax=Decorospora gaudefroyi TaxID=184978 RepID=A0A6A5K849_9PLEO|nr:hypothetical protein BDW02DRAFT_579974 [Decorospora gaudefroyi]
MDGFPRSIFGGGFGRMGEDDDFFSSTGGGPMGFGSGSMMGSGGGSRRRDHHFGGGGTSAPRQGGFTSFSSYDSSRPPGQQHTSHYQPYGDYDPRGMGEGYEPRRSGTSSRRSGGSSMLRDAVGNRSSRRESQDAYRSSQRSMSSREPVYQSVRFDGRDGGEAARRFMEEYQRTGRVNPVYASQYEEFPRRSRRSEYDGGARSEEDENHEYEDDGYNGYDSGGGRRGDGGGGMFRGSRNPSSGRTGGSRRHREPEFFDF